MPNQYFGLSTDEKPLDVVRGSIYMEIDTCSFYYFNGYIWEQMPCCANSGPIPEIKKIKVTLISNYESSYLMIDGNDPYENGLTAFVYEPMDGNYYTNGVVVVINDNYDHELKSVTGILYLVGVDEFDIDTMYQMHLSHFIETRGGASVSPTEPFDNARFTIWDDCTIYLVDKELIYHGNELVEMSFDSETDLNSALLPDITFSGLSNGDKVDVYAYCYDQNNAYDIVHFDGVYSSSSGISFGERNLIDLSGNISIYDQESIYKISVDIYKAFVIDGE